METEIQTDPGGSLEVKEGKGLLPNPQAAPHHLLASEAEEEAVVEAAEVGAEEEAAETEEETLLTTAASLSPAEDVDPEVCLQGADADLGQETTMPLHLESLTSKTT